MYSVTDCVHNELGKESSQGKSSNACSCNNTIKSMVLVSKQGNSICADGSVQPAELSFKNNTPTEHFMRCKWKFVPWIHIKRSDQE